MSFYEMTTADARAATAATPGKPAMGWLKRGLRAMQYGRMCSALSDLPDARLEQIGITRADIPRHARKCVYDEWDD